MDVNTISKQLLFTTVKITAQMPGGISTGTGFIMNIGADDKFLPVVVTNKHVIDGASWVSIRMIGRKPGEDQPKLGDAHDFVVDPSKVHFVGHPDPATDIAAVPLLPILGAQFDSIYFRTVSRSEMPTPDEGDRHDAVEEVTFVG
jgi:S1-C subfamily serine protease